MFNPSRDQARTFFFDTWRKYRNQEALEGLESIALAVILLHPEYHPLLDQPAHYQDRDYRPESGDTNPFLHLSMHLAIEEQLSVDQPPGIKAEFTRLTQQLADRHAACHEVLECLGEILWQAQRNKRAPDAIAYLECLKSR